jgi:hypothetical protein
VGVPRGRVFPMWQREVRLFGVDKRELVLALMASVPGVSLPQLRPMLPVCHRRPPQLFRRRSAWAHPTAFLAVSSPFACLIEQQANRAPVGAAVLCRTTSPVIGPDFGVSSSSASMRPWYWGSLGLYSPIPGRIHVALDGVWSLQPARKRVADAPQGPLERPPPQSAPPFPH